MSALSQAEIDQARGDLETMLPDTGTVQRKTRTSDGGGGFTERWVDQATLPCRLAPASASSGGGTGAASRGGRLNDETTHMVTFAAKTDVRLQDRVAIDGVTYEVLLVRRRGEWELSRRCEVKEAV